MVSLFHNGTILRTIISIAFLTVDNRWAIMTTVFPLKQLKIVMYNFSFSASSAEVASSKNIMRIFIYCPSYQDSLYLPTRNTVSCCSNFVLNPNGSSSMNDLIFAILTALASFLRSTSTSFVAILRSIVSEKCIHSALLHHNFHVCFW